jgi:hypothetical protein
MSVATHRTVPESLEKYRVDIYDLIWLKRNCATNVRAQKCKKRKKCLLKAANGTPTQALLRKAQRSSSVFHSYNSYEASRACSAGDIPCRLAMYHAHGQKHDQVVGEGGLCAADTSKDED